MYSPLQLSVKYIRYLIRSSNGHGHGVHSPFVFDFIKQVLQQKRSRSETELFNRLELRRKELLANNKVISISDLGAGSGVLKTSNRKISDIARSSLKSAKYARLMYRIASHYHSTRIIELGTSLGVTTTYLASAHPAEQVYSFEGATEIAKLARESFQKAGLSNIELIEGNFDDSLTAFLKLRPNNRFDLFFIDGNHRREPVMRYFNWLLPYASDQSIFIFDDIHWSPEMEMAWDQLKHHPAVHASIDLFFMGMILISSNFIEPVHIAVRY